MANGKVSEEMFDSIIREVVEEIGVPAATLVSGNPFGICLLKCLELGLNLAV